MAITNRDERVGEREFIDHVEIRACGEPDPDFDVGPESERDPDRIVTTDSLKERRPARCEVDDELIVGSGMTPGGRFATVRCRDHALNSAMAGLVARPRGRPRRKGMS